MKRAAGLTFVASIAIAAIAMPTPQALAFCRTTTCDPSDPAAGCQTDSAECVTTGKPLAWSSNCVTIGVQQLGSVHSHLGYDDVAAVVEQAFGTWNNADCAGAPPSIEVKSIGPIECGLSEYNQHAGNANVVLFREDDWPYAGAANALALTTTRFDTKTGELWDADIELNDAGMQLSVGDPITGDDLLSVLTHEAGHFLGLSHSLDPTATMRAIYDPARDGTSFRSLAPDDVAGLCAIYPPERHLSTTSCENRHGFSSQCGADQTPESTSKGCSLSSRTDLARAGATPGNWLGLLGLVAATFGARLARRRRIV